MLKEDLEYRIRNLKFAIKDFEEEAARGLNGSWERGYREGRVISMESELRFLEGLLKNIP